MGYEEISAVDLFKFWGKRCTKALMISWELYMPVTDVVQGRPRSLLLAHGMLYWRAPQPHYQTICQTTTFGGAKSLLIYHWCLSDRRTYGYTHYKLGFFENVSIAPPRPNWFVPIGSPLCCIQVGSPHYLYRWLVRDPCSSFYITIFPP
jgi:hypothetical protein